MTFPRRDDGKGWAWGLRGESPQEVWERFSTTYEAQAEEVLSAIAALGFRAELDFAGSEDGESALGLTEDGDIAVYLPLEDPVEAKLIASARSQGALEDHLKKLLS